MSLQRSGGTGVLMTTIRSTNRRVQFPSFYSTAPEQESQEFTLEMPKHTHAGNLKVFRLASTHVKAPVEACLEDPLTNTNRPAYLDNQGTTPLDPRVLDAILPYMVSLFGNPHSRTHLYGWETNRKVEEARQFVGELINAPRPSKDVVWTSGATEANNLAIKGVIEQAIKTREAKNDPRPVHVITTQIEHKCVLASCRDMLERYPDRVKVTYLPVDVNGLVDPQTLNAAIVPGETVLVSIIAVHNEIGVIQDLPALSKVVKSFKGILFHSDIAQAAGKIPIDVQALHLDLASISGHKMYGPKGVGCLFINSKTRPRIRLSTQISGGGQEGGLRSGTVPSVLVIGMGKAAQLCSEEMGADHEWISSLSNKIRTELMDKLPYIILNGDELSRYPGNLNLSFDCVEGESLIMALRDVCAISSGSACTSASLEPSYVLRAIGVGDDLAHTSLRFGIGRFTTEEEVDATIDAVVAAVKQLRTLSPLWDMKMNGISMDDMVWT
eukprot:GHVH01001551.1.p1 GENE.GHVH01001551.1~~GHVH01001551.1.p1  ORF type:complete len:497 (-),score=70.96 GHVH01001551.1:88-1578(-)